MRKKGFILLLILFSITMNGQTDMLIMQISDRIVIRENVDEEGDFSNKQTFEAGETIEKNGYFEIEAITELFDKGKNSTEKYTTTYLNKGYARGICIKQFNCNGLLSFQKFKEEDYG